MLKEGGGGDFPTLTQRSSASAVQAGKKVTLPWSLAGRPLCGLRMRFLSPETRLQFAILAASSATLHHRPLGG